MAGPIAAYAARRATPSKADGVMQDHTAEIGSLREKIYQATFANRMSFLPWLDRYTEETEAMREAYRTMLKSPVVKAALLSKVYAVSALDLEMVPASEEERDREVSDFALYAYTQALHGGVPKIAESILLPGLIDKYSVNERVWDEELWDRGRWKGKRFYRDIKAKDRITLVQDEFKNITGVRSVQFGQSAEFSPLDFVIFRNAALFEGPGMSDLRAAYGSYWFLDTVQKLRLIHLEKFTSPYFKGTYKNPDDRPQLEQELEKAKSRSWLVVPETVLVEAMQIATRGETEFQEAIKDFKEDIALAIAGAFLQMLTSHGGAGQMRGSARAQKTTSELFIWALASKLEMCINLQMTPFLVQMNYAGADFPMASLGGINDAEMKISAELDLLIQSMGFPMSKKATGKKYSRTQAEGADDLLVPIAAAAAQRNPQDPANPTPEPPIGGGGGNFAETEARIVDRINLLSARLDDLGRNPLSRTRPAVLEYALDASEAKRRAAEAAAAHARRNGDQALADVLDAIKRQPPAPKPLPPRPVEKTILYHPDGRVRGIVENPVDSVAILTRPVRKEVLYHEDGRVKAVVETPE